ncbi:MAG: alkaline phosphatase [Armatimonadaceae bacterium]
MRISRRGMLGGIGSAGVSFGFTGFPAGAEQPRSAGKETPKNIIFCVVDGMAAAALTMADYLQQLTLGKHSYWHDLMNAEDIVLGMQETRSLNSVVTDSAAASSAWGCGRRIWNGQINMFPDGTELRPIASIVQEAGMRTGLVTTTTITHATPAGFAVNCVQRDLEALIAEKYLKSGVEVLMGGGAKAFSPELRKDKRDLYADFAKAGFAVAKTRSELMRTAPKGKVLGIFNDSHMPYTVDHVNDAMLWETRPTLAEMTAHAIRNLSNSPKGFLLQIEGGRVDHGGHADDLAALVYDQIAFEEAVKVAVDFARRDGNTLVIVTADHATGGPALNGAGDEYSDSTAGLLHLKNMKCSYGPLVEAIGANPSAAKVRDTVTEKLGITLTNEEADALVQTLGGKSPFALSEFYSGAFATMGVILGNHTKVTWTSLNHTADHVVVAALGPGKDMFRGITPNYQFFSKMLAAREISFQNPPQMDLEKARPFYDKLKVGLLANPDLFEQYALHDDECPGMDHVAAMKPRLASVR